MKKEHTEHAMENADSPTQQASAWREVWNTLSVAASRFMCPPSTKERPIDRAIRVVRLLANRAQFQSRVQPWLLDCFGPVIAGDRQERNYRFLEESLELVQSCGCSREDAHQLVDYVFGRPRGEPHQEVGGVMVTLAALCLAHNLDMHDCGEIELERISDPDVIDKIRFKQATKPHKSPLPAKPMEDADG